MREKSGRRRYGDRLASLERQIVAHKEALYIQAKFLIHPILIYKTKVYIYKKHYYYYPVMAKLNCQQLLCHSSVT